MIVRSQSSLLKDELNFARILAHEVRTLLDSENLALNANQQLELACIYLKLLEADIVDSDTIWELSELLGIAHTAVIESQTEVKARLETDFANSAS